MIIEHEQSTQERILFYYQGGVNARPSKIIHAIEKHGIEECNKSESVIECKHSI
jgi:hypothetical protein